MTLHARTHPRISVLDVMQGDVVTLDASASIEDAIRVFEEYHITGAPVVNECGRPIGVLTLSDLVRDDRLRDGRIQGDRWAYYLSDPLGPGQRDPRKNFAGDVVSELSVSERMTPYVISVDPTTSLEAACRVMSEQSIHRVLVIENDRVRGIVSTTDVVRYFANATS